MHGLRLALGGLVGRSRPATREVAPGGAAPAAEDTPQPAEDREREHDPRPEEAVEEQTDERTEHRCTVPRRRLPERAPF